MLCQGTSFDYFPAQAHSVVSFVAHLFQLGYAPFSITSTLSAISYIHKVHEVADHIAAMGVADEDIQRMGRLKSQAFKKYIRLPMLKLV